MQYLPVRTQQNIKFICVKVAKEDKERSLFEKGKDMGEAMAALLQKVEEYVNVADMLNDCEVTLFCAENVSDMRKDGNLVICICSASYPDMIHSVIKSAALYVLENEQVKWMEIDDQGFDSDKDETSEGDSAITTYYYKINKLSEIVRLPKYGGMVVRDADNYYLISSSIMYADFLPVVQKPKTVSIFIKDLNEI